jgi:hypothetical protein
MKRKKALLPIIFVEGGIVQNVFLPKPEGDAPFTDVAYELVDMDIFEDQGDVEIAEKWESLEPETREYFMAHASDVYQKFKQAIDRVEAERKARERCFVQHPPRSLESLKLCDSVLRRNLTTRRIDALTLIGAMEELIHGFADAGTPMNPREIALEFSKGQVVGCGGCDYVLDDLKK